jgi:cobalt-zinc-cadmium efflux system membrane fusion protein
MDKMTGYWTGNFPRLRLLVLATLVLAGGAYLAVRYSIASTGSTTSEGRHATTSVPVGSGSVVDLSEKQAASITVSDVPLRDFTLLKTAVGTIDFNQNLLVQVSSQYPGKIIKAPYNIGDEVKTGEILFTIESPDLLQAESNLLASAGVLELQKRTLARATQLVKAGGSAQKDIDQATSDQQTAEGNFKAARNAVRIFGKTDDEIGQILQQRKVDSTLIVTSPVSGTVIARNAAPGLLSQPGATPAPFSVADISTMWMIANVIETDAPAYRLGQPVEVRVPAYPDRVFKGRVTTVGAMIDPASHRQLVRSEIEDPEHLLRPGMFASFVIQVGAPVRSLAVPVDGVVREGDGTMGVWVTTDRRRFERRTVKVGLSQNGWSQIVEGLEPNAQVVTGGAIFLSNKLVTGAEG